MWVKTKVVGHMGKNMDTKGTGQKSRNKDECPECGSQGSENPVLEDWYECNNCVIAFSADGRVSDGE